MMGTGGRVLGIGLAVLALTACEAGAGDSSSMADAGSTIELIELPDVEPAPYEVLLRETPTEHGPGRLMLRAVVPPDSEQEAVRRALVRMLEEAWRADTAVLAVRAVAYVSRVTGPSEAELVPYGWGEYLPPEGWYLAEPASRRRIYRTYTYFGRPPQW